MLRLWAICQWGDISFSAHFRWLIGASLARAGDRGANGTHYARAVQPDCSLPEQAVSKNAWIGQRAHEILLFPERTLTGLVAVLAHGRRPVLSRASAKRQRRC